MIDKKALSKGDVHLLIAGIFLGMFILVRLTDPSHYGLTLHPRQDKVWTMWRILTTAGWLFLVFIVTTLSKKPALRQSFSFAAAASVAIGLTLLSTLFPNGASWFAMTGSLVIYGCTSGALCVKIQRPIPAAFAGATIFVIQIAADILVHFFTGSISIH